MYTKINEKYQQKNPGVVGIRLCVNATGFNYRKKSLEDKTAKTKKKKNAQLNMKSKLKIRI